MNEVEGVIKFQAHHRAEKLPEDAEKALPEILGWRRLLLGLGLLGRDPNRYGGLAFGNLSIRRPPWTGEVGRRPFVVSGGQTSDVPQVGPAHFALVHSHSAKKNEVFSQGPMMPSSESLTHGAIYDLSSTIRAVIHVHSPRIFQRAQVLRLPQTPPDISYGTPEMAWAVKMLRGTSSLMERRVFVMGGHLDGVVAFGKTMDHAAQALLGTLAQAETF